MSQDKSSNPYNKPFTLGPYDVMVRLLPGSARLKDEMMQQIISLMRQGGHDFQVFSGKPLENEDADLNEPIFMPVPRAVH